MPKKKQKVILHMHQIRDFIDDRYSFYNNYFLDVKPERYTWRGMQKAFQVGSAVDYAIKTFYLNLNSPESNNPGDGILNSEEFKTLPTKLDQLIVQVLVTGYIDRYYGDEDSKEYFHNFKITNFKIPFIFGKKRKLKKDYVIYTNPDILADKYFTNELVIIEIKTSGEDSNVYSAETLDFQTMTYCWASYRWNFKIPAGVIKRTLMKPRIKQKKDETESEFSKRLVYDVTDNPEKYFKSNFREINIDMIKEFEKYLIEIIHDLDTCINKPINKYKFYKPSNTYWGL